MVNEQNTVTHKSYATVKGTVIDRFILSATGGVCQDLAVLRMIAQARGGSIELETSDYCTFVPSLPELA